MLQEMARRRESSSRRRRREIDWGTPRAWRQGCGNAKRLTSFFLLPPTCSLWSNVTSLQDVKTRRLYPSSLPLLFYWTLFLWRLPFYCHPSPYLSPLLPCFFFTFHRPHPPLSGDGKEAEAKKQREKQDNDTTVEWKQIKRRICVMKRRKDAGKWKKQHTIFSPSFISAIFIAKHHEPS